MLPSNNFFKHIFCPYDKAKLCHRPYCHYKHVEPVSAPVEEAAYLYNSIPTANAYSTYAPSPVDNDLGYVPVNNPKPSGILKSSYSSSSSMVIPEYNPTPISRLKERNPASGNLYEPSHYDPPSYKMPDAKKKKNTEEYDPTQVYFSGKPLTKSGPKKSVMFADEAGIPLEDADRPDSSGSEEDIDDSGSAPKFSDDDNDLDDYSHSRVDNDHLKSKAKAKEENEEEEEEDIPDEKSIDEFSIVDKILVSSKKSDKLIKSFKKSVLKPNDKKTKSDKSDTKTIETNKHKTINNVNKDGNVPNSKPKRVSDFDAIMSLAAFDDHKQNDSADTDSSSKSTSSKTNELPKTKSLSEQKKETTGSNKSKTSSSDKKVKESSNTSKHSDKNSDSKIKHSKHTNSSDKSKTKSDSTEKHKSTSSPSKSDKSIKSNKTKSTTPQIIKLSANQSSKTDKSIKKSDKSEPSSSHKSSKSSKDKEAKLQDEKVTSSSIAKKQKHDQMMKHSSKESSHSSKPKKVDDFDAIMSLAAFDDLKPNDTHNSSNDSSKLHHQKSKSSKSSSPSKRKANDSDDESLRFKAKRRRDGTDDDEDMSSVDGGVDEIIELTSESEEDTEEACKRIFEETFVPNDDVALSDKEDSSSSNKPHFIDVTTAKKQRLAHAGAASLPKSGPSVKRPSFHPTRNPGQVMLDRYAKMRAAAQAQRNESKDRGPNPNSPGRGKTRISIAPNHSLLAALAEKNRMAQSSNSNSFSPLPSTVTKTLKVTKRVAHIPDIAVKARPVIPIDYGSKVPTVVRQKYLNAFIDEYLKLAASEDEAYENALEEEKTAYGRSSSKAIYMNVASNTLNRLRHRVAESTDLAAAKKGEVVSSTTSSKKTVSHETVLNGPMAQRTSFSIERKKTAPVPELKGIALYEHLLTYVLTEEQLKENGYPFPHPVEVGKAVIEGIYANRIQYCNDPFKRTCSRCQKIYYVNVDGDYVRDEECDFHWGRLFKRRIAGALESRYTCCSGDSESDGCCVATGHVFEGSEAHAFKGFVSTLPKDPPPDKYYGIYALDCEMCYTTAGVELTRISVIGPDLKPVYETFVKPQNKVLDFNTRFSGITEDSLKNVRTTIRDVQAVLLCMFNSKTILIGHSLESDFKALKLFHNTVVDTSVVFPHKLGPPYKRALRNLSSEKLNKIIQNDVGGHDSAEDAVACMELMIYKIKEDLKANR